MNKLIISTALFLLVAGTSTVQAKDKHKSKHKHHDRDHDKYSDYQRSRYYAVNSPNRYSESHRDRTRTIYLIERNRPVARTVYIGPDGRYYQQSDGRRSYVTQHYFESYPTRYYTSSGQRRINISLPF